MSGSEGGGGGEIMHRRDECGFRGGKQEETEDLKMKISCKISHMGLRWGSEFNLRLTQDAEQDMADF